MDGCPRRCVLGRARTVANAFCFYGGYGVSLSTIAMNAASMLAVDCFELPVARYRFVLRARTCLPQSAPGERGPKGLGNSSRQDRRMPFGGFVGRITIEGEPEPEPLLPYLVAGQYLLVGKNTTFGLGRFVVDDDVTL